MPAHPTAPAPPAGALPPNPWAHTLHQPLFVGFLTALIVATVRLLLGFEEATPTTQTVLWITAAITSVVGVARRLPGQNVLTATLLIAGIATLLGYVGDRTSIPFGPRTFTSGLGARAAGVPWTWPLVWLVVILSARGIARLILRPWRKTTYYGFWVIGVATGLAVLFALAFEPFAGRVGRFWIWRAPDTVWNWHGAPWVNFLGWLAVALGILGFTTPWLINKQPVKQPTDYHPLVVWSLLIAYFTAGMLRQGMWAAAAVNGVALATTAILAIRGARW